MREEGWVWVCGKVVRIGELGWRRENVGLWVELVLGHDKYDGLCFEGARVIDFGVGYEQSMTIFSP